MKSKLLVFILLCFTTPAIGADYKEGNNTQKISLYACAEVTEDTLRLECFDNMVNNLKDTIFKRTSGLLKALSNDLTKEKEETHKASTKNTTGRWKFHEEIDPIDDSRTTWLTITQTESPNFSFSSKPTIQIECSNSGVFKLGVKLRQIDSEEMLTYRIDKNKPIQALWPIHEGSRYYSEDNPLSTEKLLQGLRNGSNFIIRTHSTKSTFTFDIRGLSNALKLLPHDCMSLKNIYSTIVKRQVDQTQKYFAKVKQEINDNWYYPLKAFQQGIQGSVGLKSIISSDGKLLSTTINASSGHRILDNAALKAIKESAPFHPFPAGINKEKLSLVTTFIYSPRSK